ncbi:hypothetical protein IAD21_01664 [Abditibacteriota bacterium]|nr:hypothetical protein IAD21_01664 [Abditibacteriota bacterium]
MKSLRSSVIAFTLTVLFSSVGFAAPPDSLAASFASPPPSARPWVYWMWLSSNVTNESVTADLEAMKRVGIGGAIILDVENGTPIGPMKFFDSQWQSVFQHTVSEAKRLGLEINVNNGVGYFGSGGLWVPPEKAMQWVFTSETPVTGGVTWKGTLPVPGNSGGYHDIEVLAIPTTKTNYKIPDFEMKALYWKTWVAYRGTQSAPLDAKAPSDAIIPLDRVIDLTSKMQPDGTLTWDAPPGDWTLLRIGHAYNGSKVGPAPAGQNGPETDKLSREATALHFNAFVKRLSDITGPQMRSALVGTHIDSWEGGGQNWTPAMREEFTRRRGYDPLPYLPVMSGRVVGSLQITERFLFDLRKTVSELMVENYVAPFQQMAHQQGLRFTFESYTTTGDDLDAANFADEPTAEFWTPNGQGADFYPTSKSMSSAAHLNGRSVVGAEAFTSGGSEKWLWHPAMIKDIGDDAFTQGVNRFVFHRYAAQRFVDRKPGLQMGPWGLHYERTNTWWDWSGPWHQYLARCQYLLRQGESVTDVLDLQSEEPLLRFQVAPLAGYDYDACGPNTFKTMSARNGRLTLPSGRNYRLLLLPNTATMTVPMLTHIRDLVRRGAAIVGNPPQSTPGLTDFPHSDAQLKTLVAELWGMSATVPERNVGQGRVFCGITPEAALARLSVTPDFTSTTKLRWIHRQANGTDFYFVANPTERTLVVSAGFRVTGRQPELWNPETGTVTRTALFVQQKTHTDVRLHLGAKESVFVVFPKAAKPLDPITTVAKNNLPLFINSGDTRILVEKATYGVPDDPERTRDVREKAQRLLDNNPSGFNVGDLATGDDPAWGIVKTLVLDYTVDGQPVTYTGKDTDRFKVKIPAAPLMPWLEYDPSGHLVMETPDAGRYEIRSASGRKATFNIPSQLPAQTISGPWQVRFAPGGGAPAQVQFDQLLSWSDHPDPGVKYYSGPATYAKTITLTPAQLAKGKRLYLDLGDVQVMARVALNGRDLGILWKTPYRMDISTTARAGTNTLEITVVNLWVNRLIGDEQLPEDSDRNPNGTLRSWPQWVLDNQPSPTGRQTFSSWRLWRKNDPLQPSGLLGPVTLTEVTRQNINLKN